MSDMLTAPADRESQPATDSPQAFAGSDRFVRRHIGPDAQQERQMLEVCGFPTLDALADAAVPGQIPLRRPLNLPASRGDDGLLGELEPNDVKDQGCRSFICEGHT